MARTKATVSTGGDFQEDHREPQQALEASTKTP